MAVRLHLQFDRNNPEHIRAIEEIAQVPAGTHAAVQQYREEAKSLAYAGGDAGYEHWASLQDTPVGVLDAFLTFGWGRLTPLGRQIAALTDDDAHGLGVAWH